MVIDVRLQEDKAEMVVRKDVLAWAQQVRARCLGPAPGFSLLDPRYKPGPVEFLARAQNTAELPYLPASHADILLVIHR